MSIPPSFPSRPLLPFLVLPLLLNGCGRQPVGKEEEAARPAPVPVARKKPAPPRPEPYEARALYVTGWTAGGTKAMERIMALIDKTPLNAVVIDVKDSDGAVSYPSEVPLVRQIMAKAGSIKEINRHGYAQRTKNIDKVLAELKRRDIYPIARIAVFSDDILPRVRPDLSVKRKNGGNWENRKGEAWTNPYQQEVWEYNVTLAEEALKKGFKEIQWDYVRFPTDGKLLDMRFPGKTATPQHQQIANFMKFARKRIHAAGGVMSADIFGLTVLSKNDMGIGQTIRSIAENTDIICPMVYPSHYNRGEYGLSNPDRAPYQTVFLSLRDGKKRIAGTKCKIRPWLQNFHLQSKYYAPDIWAQIKAARDNGINEYLLWDPRNKFTHTAEAFRLQAAAEAKEKRKKQVVKAEKPATTAPDAQKAVQPD